MKTLHVTIRLGVGPDDDGAFDDFDARSIWNALCRAFPLCRGGAIEVEPVNVCDPVVDEPSDCEHGDFYGDREYGTTFCGRCHVQIEGPDPDADSQPDALKRAEEGR